jgi:uncharacterized membrane protein
MQKHSPLQLIVFIFLLGLLLALVQLGLLTIAFEKLGLSASTGFLILFMSLFGSAINIPLFRLTAQVPLKPLPPTLWQIFPLMQPAVNGKTLIAVNVGGCLIPLSLAFYLAISQEISPFHIVLGIMIVSMICYLFSRPIAGLGIGMPMLVAPIAAALSAVLLDPQHSAPLAYIIGTLGVIVGADLLRLKDILRMGTAIASIGGAGTFDGIFITGIVAILLA